MAQEPEIGTKIPKWYTAPENSYKKPKPCTRNLSYDVLVALKLVSNN